MLKSLSVKSYRTPRAVTFFPFRVLNLTNRSTNNNSHYRIPIEIELRLTAYGNTNVLSTFGCNSDIHITREISAVELGYEIEVHVKGVSVDV